MTADPMDFPDGNTTRTTPQPTTTFARKVAMTDGLDLSAEIAATITREPGDRVRCTWIAGTNYRCNWWARRNTNGYDNPGMCGLTVTTHQVRKSQFLSVTKIDGDLIIRDRSGGRTPVANS